MNCLHIMYVLLPISQDPCGFRGLQARALATYTLLLGGNSSHNQSPFYLIDFRLQRYPTFNSDPNLAGI